MNTVFDFRPTVLNARQIKDFLKGTPSDGVPMPTVLNRLSITITCHLFNAFPTVFSHDQNHHLPRDFATKYPVQIYDLFISIIAICSLGC